MDDELARNYRRWRDADADDRDDEADASFRAMFERLGVEPVVAREFTARTMDAVSTAAAHDALVARRTRRALIWGGLVGGAAGAYATAGLLVSGVTTGLTWLISVVAGGVVSLASGADAGAGLWSVLSNLGRAAAAFVADPAVTVTMLAIQGIAVAALVALQRLLGSDGESLK